MLPFSTVIIEPVWFAGLAGREQQDSHDSQHLPSPGKQCRDSEHPQICARSQEGQDPGSFPTVTSAALVSQLAGGNTQPKIHVHHCRFELWSPAEAQT